MTRAVRPARLALGGAVAACVLGAAPPALADEVDVQLYTAAFGGTGAVVPKDPKPYKVEVEARGSQCNAVVVTGLQSTVVPCAFTFEAPLDESAHCTGTAAGPGTLTVTLPDGLTHDFVYDVLAIVDETSISGFGTTTLSPGPTVRIGSVKFDTVTTGCGVAGPNVGTALY